MSAFEALTSPTMASSSSSSMVASGGSYTPAIRSAACRGRRYCQGHQIGARYPAGDPAAGETAQPDHRGPVRHVQVSAGQNACEFRVGLCLDHEVQVHGADLKQPAAADCTDDSLHGNRHRQRIDRHPCYPDAVIFSTALTRPLGPDPSAQALAAEDLEVHEELAQ